MQQIQVEAGRLVTHFELLLPGNVEPEEEDEAAEDIVLMLVANGLAEEVEHAEVKVIFLDFAVADLEVVEKGDDEILELLLVVEVEVVGVGVDEGDESA